MKHRRFTIHFLASFLAFTATLLSVAVVVDPGWMFSFDHPLNRRQRGYDERTQKRNLLATRDVEAHMVVLGSSRTTFIDPADFGDNKQAFNFAVSGVMPAEYPVILDYALAHLRGPVSEVVLGLDFFGALDKANPVKPMSAPTALERLRANFSMDMVELAAGNVHRSLTDDKIETYDRAGRRFLDHKDSARQDKDFAYELKKIVEYRYPFTKTYDPDLRATLAELPRRWPDLAFHVFTTPVSAAQYEGMVCQGRLPDWERWLTDAVAVFGTIHHFMDINPVTQDRSFWADSHHFYPEIGRIIARTMMGMSDTGAPAGFGVRLDSTTLPDYLAAARTRASSIDCEALARRWRLTLTRP